MPLNKLERDLHKYAKDKLITYIKDVAQSFEIAGIKQDSVPCLGSVLMRAAATFTQFCGASREEFLELAGEMYDGAAKHAEKRREGSK